MSAALPPGHVWLSHQGKRERARHLRQLAQSDARRRKVQFGVEVGADGRTPAGLIVPGAAPAADGRSLSRGRRGDPAGWPLEARR